MSAMERSERSFTAYMRSKLFDCEQACASLTNQLTVLEQRWQPKSLRMKQREDEVREIHKALKKCIKAHNDMAGVCDLLENQIGTLEDQCADMEMFNKDSEEQIKKYVTTIEEFKNHNEKISVCLHQAEEKIKELSEKNSSMLLQLSGRKHRQGAESEHPSSASAHGSE